MRAKRTIAIAVLATVAVLPTAFAQNATETTYNAKCAMCHGKDGLGETPAGKKMGVRSFKAPEVTKQSDKELTDVITNGKNKMPKYGEKLKAEEINELVKYVHTLQK